MRERAVLLGEANRLLGVVTEPSGACGASDRVGVLLLNAGLLHHVGPNRLYVNVARRLAEQGALALRFDFSGIGDSPPREDAIPFDELAARESSQAMDYLGTTWGLDRFVLIGVCSGADVAFEVASRDPRVVGGVVINGALIRSGSVADALPDLATHVRLRYYRKRLFDPGSWLRILTGRSDYRALVGTLSSRSQEILRGGPAGAGRSTALDRTAETLKRGVRLLFVYSEGSQAFDLFRLNLQAEFEGMRDHGRLDVTIFKDVDHVFTMLQAQRDLIERIAAWMRDQGWLAGTVEPARTAGS